VIFTSEADATEFIKAAYVDHDFPKADEVLKKAK
jgi:hypothetical protein